MTDHSVLIHAVKDCIAIKSFYRYMKYFGNIVTYKFVDSANEQVAEYWHGICIYIDGQNVLQVTLLLVIHVTTLNFRAEWTPQMWWS